MGACARNMQSDPAEIKPAQCCIKLVFSFDLYYDARKHKIKKKDRSFIFKKQLCPLTDSVIRKTISQNILMKKLSKIKTHKDKQISDYSVILYKVAVSGTEHSATVDSSSSSVGQVSLTGQCLLNTEVLRSPPKTHHS